MHNWRRVTRADRCPVCKHDSWCLVSETAALCMRMPGGRLRELQGGEQGWIYDLKEPLPRPLPYRQPEPETVISVGPLISYWKAHTSDFQYTVLAGCLGVKRETILQLDAVWASEHRAWAFPMRDGFNQYCGIRLRSVEGAKWAVRGSHTGLFIPQRPPEDTLVITEGPTDCLAALTLGYFAVGRPSCSGGVDHLRSFCRQGVRRAIVICDNDDPGLRGADGLPQHLGIPTATLVLPCKDLREFLVLGGTKACLESLLRAVVWRQPEYERNGIESLCQGLEKTTQRGMVSPV